MTKILLLMFSGCFFIAFCYVLILFVFSVRAGGQFQNYEGGIFAGCTSDRTDHAVTVVGYGTDAASGDCASAG